MALQKSPAETRPGRAPFEHVFSALADEAEARLWASVEDSVASRFALSARDDLRALLIGSLCGLCASVLYEGFVQSSVGYDAFVEDMTAGGLIRLFDEKPVLLRLVATTTRQWLTTSSELLNRLDGDLKRIRHDILHRDADTQVTHIQGGLSDLHHGGRAVLRVEFDDGSCCHVQTPRSAPRCRVAVARRTAQPRSAH